MALGLSFKRFLKSSVTLNRRDNCDNANHTSIGSFPAQPEAEVAGAVGGGVPVPAPVAPDGKGVLALDQGVPSVSSEEGCPLIPTFSPVGAEGGAGLAASARDGRGGGSELLVASGGKQGCRARNATAGLERDRVPLQRRAGNGTGFDRPDREAATFTQAAQRGCEQNHWFGVATNLPQPRGGCSCLATLTQGRPCSNLGLGPTAPLGLERSPAERPACALEAVRGVRRRSGGCRWGAGEVSGFCPRAR